MDKDPKDNKNLACFLRHRGPPILPFSEVVYVVHPYLMTHIFSKGTAPEDLSQRNFDRICRAFSGQDVSIFLQCKMSSIANMSRVGQD